VSKTTHDYAWLKQFCGDLSRVVLPFMVAVPGYKDKWFAATDGKRAIVLQALEGKHDPKEDLGDGPDLAKLLAKENVDLQMMSRQEIIDLYPPDERMECPKCAGRGTWACGGCDGTGEKMVECQDCGHEHLCVCDECQKGIVTCNECDGEKTVWKESIETWTKRVHGVQINGQLLVPILASFEDKNVAICRVVVSSDEKLPVLAVKVSGDGWAVMVCERSEYPR
jgi:hypothetical protein